MDHARLASLALPLLLVTLAGTGPASAQEESWSWPERAENLQQLPADFPGSRLRAVMTGFTRSLGVSCSYCHVGEEGEPLSSYDFPSDDNPMKRTARQMLEMLGAVNDQLAKVEPSGERVNMWCFTCHHGKPKPATLGEELSWALEEGGVDAMVARYRDLRQRYYGTDAYNFSERTLNALGYRALGQDQHEAAIAFFRLNAEHHPSSANVWDSLAEGYLESGQKELARIHYEKSLTLDPTNRNALEKLAELSGQD